MAAHSSVQYVEPNSDLENISNYSEYVTTDARVYDKVINPEDYCIALSITTELSNRVHSIGGGTQVIKLTWENTSEDAKVNFFSGTLVPSTKNDSIKDNTNIPYMTTNYADMYVTDLKHYGTTEMIGIKSVNIDFENAVLPVITIQFTDVRGMSLFTPREFSGLNDLAANATIDASNVAQCFFQCFFKFPYPKFNITVKGFYGKPVSYEVTCDKFETDFNAENGNFDVTVRFIGYRYSFLTDIATELILAAPYSDYIGQKYWEEKKQSGDFTVTDIFGQKTEMPTLIDIRNRIKDILTNAEIDSNETTLTREDDTHDEERRQLESIKNTYTAWYNQLWIEVVRKYGQENCFIRTLNSGEYDRIIVLNNSNSNNLSEDATQFSNEMQKVNGDLYALIEKYNESYGGISPLENLSKDYSKYLNVKLFNTVTKNYSDRFVFNGYVEDAPISKVIADEMIMNRIGIDGEQDLGSAERHQKTLKTVYNDGSKQKLKCYHIDLDYTVIQRRINKLTEDANRSYNSKKKQKDLHDRNVKLVKQLGFNPTISNFTKIAMAHLETLMHMIYATTNEIKNDESRKASSLGLSIGSDGNFPDVEDNGEKDVTIPPFPRVTEMVTESDGTQKQQDVWIGKFDKDQFREVDLVETFFNAIETIRQLIKQTDEKIEETKNDRINAENGIERGVVRYPLTSYDFFLKSNVYGDDVISTIENFAGAISIRMCDILSINFFANQFKTSWHGKAEQLGRVEAHNFYKSVDISSNTQIRDWIKLDSGRFNAKYVLSAITSHNQEDKYPWTFGSLNDNDNRNPNSLFSSDNWLLRYPCSSSYVGDSFMYPVQNISFDTIQSNYDLFKRNGENLTNYDVILSQTPKSVDSIESLNMNEYNAHYNLIICDDYMKVKNMMDASVSESFETYTKVSEVIFNACSLDKALENYYKEIFKDNGVSSFCRTQNKANIETTITVNADSNDSFPLYDKDGNIVKDKENNEIKYTSSKQDLEEYFNTEINGKHINSCFISEIFSYDSGGNISHVSSVLNNNNFSPTDFLMGIDCIDYNNLRQKGGINKLLTNCPTFIYIPRFVVLQLGAVLCSEITTMSNINATIDINKLSINVPLGFKQIITQYLNTISIYSRIVLMRYYSDWVKNEFPNIKAQFNDKNSEINVAVIEKRNGYVGRVLLNQKSSFVKSLTDKMMLPVLLIHGNVTHFTGAEGNDSQYGRYTLTRERYRVSNESVYEKYLNGFIDELNQLLQVDYTVDSGGNMVRRSAEAKNTSDEMRMELYRYLKQIYDKWIPSTNENDWNFKNFFEDEKGSGNYKFYFIDSYYNQIGDKLLINPSKLLETINVLLNNVDISSNLLSLLSVVYTDNRCLFKCIQNFINLSDRTSMENMFKPLPYSEAYRNTRNGSDFVVVYTYEPSKFLDVNSNEYADDSFMLNDESNSPMSIRTRGAKGDFYRIPAFGVTYGKQYQSFFKKVKVNTKNALQTEQVILAKHAILRGVTNKNKNGTQGQDMFDLYTSQSYTCTVEMMGCAWVQPMMYFVLLNVPMFRGSYMIMKVNHSITPGNMTTTFTGCRMGKVANKFVEDVFINAEGDDTEYVGSDTVTFNNAMANNDNDCPYAVFPIFGGYNTLSGDEKQMGKQLMDTLIGRGVVSSRIAAAGIVGNLRQECGAKFDYRNAVVDSDGYIAGGICMWNDRYGNLTHLLELNPSGYGQPPVRRISTTLGISGVKNRLNELTLENQIDFLKNTMGSTTKQKLEGSSTPEQAAEVFRARYEVGDNANARMNFAKQFYDSYGSTQVVTDQNELTKMNEDVYELFFSAINKTAQNTESMKFELKNEYYPNKTDKNKVMMVSAANSKDNPKLAKLFDCILNTQEYFRYINDLYWVYDENVISDIVRIDLKLSAKDVASNNQHVHFFLKGSKSNGAQANSGVFKVEDLSDDLKHSLGKKYGEIGKDKLNALLGGSISDVDKLADFAPSDCASVGTTSSSSSAGPFNTKSWNLDTFIQKLHYWQGHICEEKGKPRQSYGGCGTCSGVINRALRDSGYAQKYWGEYPWNICDKLKGNGSEFTEAASGITSNKQEFTFNGVKPSRGDICAMWSIPQNAKSGLYHTCAFDGSKWISDFVQNTCNVYRSKKACKMEYHLFKHQ